MVGDHHVDECWSFGSTKGPRLRALIFSSPCDAYRRVGMEAADRALVAQAQLMVSLQADCTLDAALALISDTARATDATMDYVAGEVVNGRVRFV
jgi:hypothetical protein